MPRKYVPKTEGQRWHDKAERLRIAERSHVVGVRQAATDAGVCGYTVIRWRSELDEHRRKLEVPAPFVPAPKRHLDITLPGKWQRGFRHELAARITAVVAFNPAFKPFQKNNGWWQLDQDGSWSLGFLKDGQVRLVSRTGQRPAKEMEAIGVVVGMVL